MTLRSKLKKAGATLGLVAMLGGAGMSLPRNASADEIKPLAAARVAGSYGSDWHDRQQLRNPTSETLSGDIYLVERGESFDPATNPAFSYSLPPGTSTTIDDLYETLKPGEAGAATLWLVPDDGQREPIWTAQMYNLEADGGELGAFAIGFDPETDGYHSAGTTLGTILASEGYRDNPHVISGPEGLAGTWVYKNSAGGNEVTSEFSIDANTTRQWGSGVRSIIGFAPEPGSQLDLIINEGSGRIYKSTANNNTNDSAYTEFEVISQQDTSAAAYVGKWMPPNDSGFYLANHEIRAMINGGAGTRSYAQDMAEILFNHSNPQPPGDAAQLEELLYDLADGDTSNDEFWQDYDPIQWDGSAGVRTYQEPDGQEVTDFMLSQEGRQLFYDLVRDEFLVRYVDAHPATYGGEPGGSPNMDYNPTWNWQDPN